MTALSTLDPAPPPPPPPASSPARAERRARDPATWALLALAAVGLALRFALAHYTWGTNDADSWVQFGYYINDKGILLEYQWDKYLNHPPIPAYWSMVVYRMTQDPPWDVEFARPPGFPFVFKIPVILADVAAAWLLYKLWKPRRGARRAALIAAGYAWSLCAILVSGYHTNTDPIYAVLCLACVYLIEARGRHFWAAVALAAAINVKLTPILLIPPLVLSYRSWRDLLRFLAGLSLGVIPFVPVFWYVGKYFYANAVAYKSNPDSWGITYLLTYLQGGPTVDLGDAEWGHRPISDWYFNHGKTLVLALIGVWSVVARVLGRWDRYQLCAVTLAIFLFFAPGFGVQYVVIALPLMFAAWPAMAAAYGLVAGLFLLVVYWAQWPGAHHVWPPNSRFKGRFPYPSAWYGVAAWALLGWFLVRQVWVRRRTRTRVED